MSTPALDPIRQLLASDPSVEVVGEERGVGGRVVPIADRGTAGFALGLALAGRRVAMSLAGTGRLAAVVEVLAEAGSIATAGEFPVTLVVRVPYGTEVPGLDAPVGGIVGELPGVTVVCPSSPGRVGGVLRTALSRPSPTVVLEPRGAVVRDVGDPEPFAARVVRQAARAYAEDRAGKGRGVTLAAWGPGVAVAEAAADALAIEDIDADVLDLVVLAPVDRTTLGMRVRATGRLVVVDAGDPALVGQVHRAAVGAAFDHLEAPVGAAKADVDAVVAAVRAAVAY